MFEHFFFFSLVSVCFLKKKKVCDNQNSLRQFPCRKSKLRNNAIQQEQLHWLEEEQLFKKATYNSSLLMRSHVDHYNIKDLTLLTIHLNSYHNPNKISRL